jgi:putative tryptophan/tyrosine transport system substrate-binding protein
MWFSAVGYIITLILSLLVTPLAAEAQPRIKVPRIGYIGDTPGPYAEAFRQGLRERGYVEGETIAIEYRWQEGRHERLPDLVAELVQLQVDVLVPVGTQPSRAAKQATSTIPIVMAQVGDPVGSGLVTNLARPGGNITGVSVIGTDIAVKQLELLKEAVPQASQVAVLWNPTNQAAVAGLKAIQGAAQGLGVTLHVVAVQQPEEFESAFAAIRAAQVDALHVTQDHLLFSQRTRIVDFAAQSRLPAIYMYREWADAGGLMAYGASLREVHRRVAELVDKILKGAKPADLPVEQVTRLHLVLNLKTAQALGLTLPPMVLFQADEILR